MKGIPDKCKACNSSKVIGLEVDHEDLGFICMNCGYSYYRMDIGNLLNKELKNLYAIFKKMEAASKTRS